jgi:hypothetical protein
MADAIVGTGLIRIHPSPGGPVAASRRCSGLLPVSIDRLPGGWSSSGAI